ncbi:MAG: LysM peptidoglycan-binding domain-containing protein [Actinomycetota bacterium]|nr:LysM peptidoglycan-binding domain-containing protein [Actinomycetota bacterium]
MRQKPIVAALAGAVVVLSGGVAFAATQSSGGVHPAAQMPAAKWSSAMISVPPTTAGPAPASPSVPSTPAASMASPTTTPPTTAAPGATPPATAPPPAATPTTDPSPASATAGSSPAQAPISYTVMPGDTLSTIATWFKLHGYQALYQANMAVVGNNPDLIFPGQKITIANGAMIMSQP